MRSLAAETFSFHDFTVVIPQGVRDMSELITKWCLVCLLPKWIHTPFSLLNVS
jgi:hypothetical protein